MARDNKFIGVFVNNMYIIIIGLGMTNYVFTQDFSSLRVFDTLSVLFVTLVVLLYWWDWTEFIESEVVSSKRELFIDFIIFFCIELLYVFYDQPLRMAFAFLLLGFADLIWVTNYIYEMNAKQKGSTIDKTGWIFEKLLCITLYGISFLAIWFIDIGPYTVWVDLAIIIGTFLLVRNIGFLNVKKDKIFFCNPDLDDVPALLKINKSYLGKKRKDGYLINKMELAEVTKDIEKEDCPYYVAKGREGTVLGYVKVSQGLDEEYLQDIEWLEGEIRRKVETEPCIYVDQVAVARGNRHKGIARFIYQNLLDSYPQRNFAAFIIEKPVENRISMKFHEKLGFRKGAVFSREEYLGIQNFKSILYFRDKKGE